MTPDTVLYDVPDEPTRLTSKRPSRLAAQDGTVRTPSPASSPPGRERGLPGAAGHGDGARTCLAEPPPAVEAR
mgnify:CR=1 FL=1